MAEEPTLPILPAVSWDERSQSFSQSSRKRTKLSGPGNGASSTCNSSDPAIFSSDDDPGIDNYVAGRRKRKYVGSWYQQQPTSSDSTFSEVRILPKPKRSFKRQLDSGVYLGSDTTDSDGLMEPPPPPDRPGVIRLEKPVARISEAERAAREKVNVCVENGEEMIDFWSLGLEELSNETIRPLSHISCIPQVTKDVAFEQKEPELKVYLAMNRLTSLPGALFDIANLTVLSLRENKLTELPPAIGKLKNLRELNIAQNRIRFLPPEFLELLQSDAKLQQLIMFPNPFMQTKKALLSDGDLRQMVYLKDSTQQPRFLSRFLGRSAVQIMNSQGRVLSEFSLRSHEKDLAAEVTVDQKSNPVIDSSRTVRPSAVPSLMEVALRSCYKRDKPEELLEYFPDAPPHIQDLLETVAARKTQGGLPCSRCKKLMIQPTVEWVEWRQFWPCVWNKTSPRTSSLFDPTKRASHEMMLPFRYQVCSWRCGPVDKPSQRGWGDQVEKE